MDCLKVSDLRGSDCFVIADHLEQAEGAGPFSLTTSAVESGIEREERGHHLFDIAFPRWHAPPTHS
jgi:hypothetical protein